jgi:hypothetical protein
VLRYPWTRRGLPWKLYLPLVTDEPVERQCSGCKIARRGGMKLWWRRINTARVKGEMEVESYLCHACYFPSDGWLHAMPEGYEDVKSYKECLERKIQLDGLHVAKVGQSLATETHQKANRITRWCGFEWVRNLPWKIHRPILFAEKTYDRCARCKYSRHRALRLWWRSSTETICNLCHAKGDWNDIMPQGYEDARSMKELRARKAQLDEVQSEQQSHHEK